MIYELRRYTLLPGTWDITIDLFEREFLETQEETGMEIVAQFRDPAAPDTFTWIRAFPDMESRHRSLTDFYTGPVWKAHRDAARATMIGTDDVLLLRPTLVTPFAGLSVPRPPITEDGPDVAASPYHLIVHHVTDGFRAHAARALTASGVTPAACFETETAPNTYTALPVREGENVFVLFTRGGPAPELADAGPHLTAPPQHFHLHPTPRSRLR